MFTLSLENVCKDYHLLIDGQESPFEINSKMIGTYKGLLTEGTHKIQIYKPVANESFQRGCLLHWLSALASSYDDNVISARRSHVKVNIIIEIDIKNQEQELIFDTYTNKVLNCSEEYRILLEEISEDEKKRKKVKKYIHWPVLILGVGVAVPLFLLSFFLMISSFDLLSFVLFVSSCVFLAIVITAIVIYKKNKW